MMLKIYEKIFPGWSLLLDFLHDFLLTEKFDKKNWLFENSTLWVKVHGVLGKAMTTQIQGGSYQPSLSILRRVNGKKCHFLNNKNNPKHHGLPASLRSPNKISFDFIPYVFLNYNVYLCWLKNTNLPTIIGSKFHFRHLFWRPLHSPTTPGVAKRLASNLETLAPEEVATAAQSLVALRHAPTKLMEATQKVAQLKWFLKKNVWNSKSLDTKVLWCF